MTESTVSPLSDQSIINWALDKSFPPLPDWADEVGPWEFDVGSAHRQCEKVLGRSEITNILGSVEGCTAVSIVLDDFYNMPTPRDPEPEANRFESINIQFPPCCEEITPEQARGIAKALVAAADMLDPEPAAGPADKTHPLQLIRRALENSELGAIDVAEALGSDEAEALNILSGHRELMVEDLITIAKLTQIPVDTLVAPCVALDEEANDHPRFAPAPAWATERTADSEGNHMHL